MYPYFWHILYIINIYLSEYTYNKMLLNFCLKGTSAARTPCSVTLERTRWSTNIKALRLCHTLKARAVRYLVSNYPYRLPLNSFTFSSHSDPSIRPNFREHNETSVAGWERSDGHAAAKSAGTASRRGAPGDGRGRTGAHAAEGTPGDDGEATVALGVQSDHHAVKRTYFAITICCV